jgi:hypothetical protein
MSYSVRFYEDGDEVQIVSLLDKVFDGWPKLDLLVSNLEYWRWKHKPSMIYDNTIAVGVNEANEIVGCNHRPLVKAKIGEEEILMQHGVDLAVHPNYRRMGMSNKTRHTLPMSYVRYGSTVNPIVKNTRLNQGIRFQSPIYIYKKISDYTKYKEKNSVNRLWLYRHNLQEKIDSIKKGRKKESKYNPVLVEKFDMRINDFWNYIKQNYDFSIKKDMEYLNWRYRDSRGGEYKAFIVEDEDIILGYGVARINRYNPSNPVGSIVELVTKYDDVEVSDSLIFEIDRLFDKEGVNERNIWVVKDSRLAKIISGNGYVNTYWDIFIHFNNNDGSQKEKLELLMNAKPDRINFHMGDTDAI